jgi:DnaK suppressor protein
MKGAAMDTMRTGRLIDQLRKRREQVAMTLRHLRKEQAEVDLNTDWLDQAAYDSRVRLLDRLNEWYVTEIDQIDKALGRAEKNNYGLCAACHQPIEDARLAAAPETEFCGACQNMREGLQRAVA